jgi:hypothetical protein
MRLLWIGALFVMVGFVMSLCSSCGTNLAATTATAQDLCLQYVNSHTTDLGGTITKAQLAADLSTIQAGGIPADCANLKPAPAAVPPSPPVGAAK